MNAMARLLEADAITRLVDRDPTLFSEDVDQRQPIMQRLGWTDLAEKAAARLPLVTNLASALHTEGTSDVVLLGMGGSSLAPLVMNEVLGQAPGAPRLHVLDTTSPDVVAPLLEQLDPALTAFVLASKSGTTIEPLSLYAIFREWMDAALGRVRAGKRFIAVTDPGSPLERKRAKDIMRIAVSAPPTVGGRFSALSVFGLTPGALACLDLAGLVEHALEMERACQIAGPENPGADLAAWIADSHSDGRDKLTLVTSGALASFGLWVEQLVAESTGKGGVGIVPVLEDGSVPVAAYRGDRMLVVLRTPDDTVAAAHAASALKSGIPLREFVLEEPAALGGEFVRWAYATALAGFLLGVNPFDEPNVAEAKSATASVLAGEMPVPAAVCDLDGIWPTPAGSLEYSGIPGDLRSAIDTLVDTVNPGVGYLAILAYLQEGEEFALLRDAASTLSTRRGFPVCVEVGPRYLHSTGQLHKGGPPTGSFLVITRRSRTDLAVPDQPFSLGALYRAQAEGDLVTLAAHRRPVLRLDLPEGDAGIRRVADALGAKPPSS